MGNTVMVLTVALVSLIVGVFLSVLGVVCMVKVLQIAEDLRYIRSKSDIHVNRPEPHKKLVVTCLVVSVVLIVLCCAFVLMYAQGLANGAGQISLK